ncbi:hypothetical protein BC629DRAFT_745896 [Irpex lacteus]|nr:hypothetical protein BC629DRAFT_745896 [Irpex lacteus]
MTLESPLQAALRQLFRPSFHQATTIMYAWNTTVEDTSAILDFHPYSDGSASSGWAPYFEDIGFWSGQPGVDSFGKNSVHITELSGASVTFRFEGTAIYLYGTQNCSYSVTVDSQPASIPFQSSLPDGMLFWQDNLSASTHTVSLTANPQTDSDQQLAFDKAVFTNIGINATGISPVLIDNQNLTNVHYTGEWKNQSFYNVPSDFSPSPYFETSSSKDTVSISFTGGVAVAINGARDWGHWTYNVTMDGAVSPIYNASTWWLMGDTVLFYQSNLDPQKTHTLELANLGTPGDKLSLNYFTVYVCICISSALWQHFCDDSFPDDNFISGAFEDERRYHCRPSSCRRDCIRGHHRCVVLLAQTSTRGSSHHERLRCRTCRSFARSGSLPAKYATSDVEQRGRSRTSACRNGSPDLSAHHATPRRPTTSICAHSLALVCI